MNPSHKNIRPVISANMEFTLNSIVHEVAKGVESAASGCRLGLPERVACGGCFP